jgi:hypothetical protein
VWMIEDRRVVNRIRNDNRKLTPSDNLILPPPSFELKKSSITKSFLFISGNV